MDTTDLPLPPANPRSDWEPLLEHFRQCLNQLMPYFGRPCIEAFEPLSGDPLKWIQRQFTDFIHGHTYYGIKPDRDNFRIHVPQSTAVDVKELVRTLFVHPAAEDQSVNGRHAWQVADWFYYFIYYVQSDSYAQLRPA